MGAIKIADNVYSVGVKDPELKIFDIVMPTEFGTTYNSYLIKGSDKIALVDTVKKEFIDEFLTNISEVTPFDKIDYLIVNHNEPDHSGAITTLLERNPNLKIYCSAAGLPFVRNVINREADLTGLKDNATLELGGKTLTFATMPYMHWPDTMVEFLAEDGILFSNDLFAAHYSSDSIYADEIDGDVDHEVEYYWDAIMRPFTGFARKNLTKLDQFDVKTIAPSHGPLFRDDAKKRIDDYKKWSVDKSEGRNLVSIFYASNYGNTKLVAETIGTHLSAAGYETALVNAEVFDEDRMKEQIEASKAVVIGTPTFNGDAVPPIWNLVNLFSTVYRMGKKAAVFGSYGWGGEGAKLVAERMSGLKLKVFEEQYRARLVPSDEEMTELGEYTKRLAEFIG